MAEALTGPGGLGLAKPEAPAREEEAWSAAKRFGFRWLFSYAVLYVLPFPFDLLDMLRGNHWVFFQYVKLWKPVVVWTGKRLFGLDITVMPAGSGDTTFNYVQLLCYAVAATVAAALWTAADRRRTSYDRLYDWLRASVRLYLGYTMLSYGFAKIFKAQFPYPSADTLMEPFGDASPMGLLWTFMGASAAYNVFTGLGEAVGGLLLFSRRTTLLGSLVCIGVLANVVMLNMSYDVPVKLLSLHLLGFAVFLAAHDLERLLDMFVRDRVPAPAQLRPLLTTRRWHWAAIAARSVLALVLVVAFARNSRASMARYGDLAPKPRDYGVWSVDAESVDGVPRPPLATDGERWRSVVFERSWVTVQLMSNQLVSYSADFDEAKGLVTFTAEAEADNAVFRFVRTGPDRLELRGAVHGHQLELTLRRLPPKSSLLLSRGFHWINEVPFSR
jgi:uncharacterized membrane protein YphA (DoxX/SURF4 family)